MVVFNISSSWLPRLPGSDFKCYHIWCGGGGGGLFFLPVTRLPGAVPQPLTQEHVALGCFKFNLLILFLRGGGEFNCFSSYFFELCYIMVGYQN
jgi:hypothetical protein